MTKRKTRKVGSKVSMSFVFLQGTHQQANRIIQGIINGIYLPEGPIHLFGYEIHRDNAGPLKETMSIMKKNCSWPFIAYAGENDEAYLRMLW